MGEGAIGILLGLKNMNACFSKLKIVYHVVQWAFWALIIVSWWVILFMLAKNYVNWAFHGWSYPDAGYKTYGDVLIGYQAWMVINGLFYIVSIPWIIAIMMYWYILRRQTGSSTGGYANTSNTSNYPVNQNYSPNYNANSNLNYPPQNQYNYNRNVSPQGNNQNMGANINLGGQNYNASVNPQGYNQAPKVSFN